MKMFYEEPDVRVIRFGTQDIITTSGDGGDGEIDGGDEDLG